MSKRSQQQCENHGPDGQKPGKAKCRFHGAASPQAQRANARRREERRATDEATSALKRYEAIGGPELAAKEPLEALIEAVTVAWRMVTFLRQHVSENSILWAKDHLEDARAEIHVDLLERWVKVLGVVSKAALEAGVQERQITIAEQQAEMILRLLDGVLEDLQLTEKQRRIAPGIVERHLRIVSSEEAS